MMNGLTDEQRQLQLFGGQVPAHRFSVVVWYLRPFVAAHSYDEMIHICLWAGPI